MSRTNWAWKIAKLFFPALKLPAVRRFVSREYTDYLATRTPPRPTGYSLVSDLPKPAVGEGPITDYVSWRSLTDHKFSARHLPPIAAADTRAVEPPASSDGQWDATTELWRRRGRMDPCSRSSVLFAFFAQWFTDSILQVDASDRRKNTSTHDIDLCQIYGQTEATTSLLRSRDPAQPGQLAHRLINGEEYLDLLFEENDGELEPKSSYAELPYVVRANGEPSVLDTVLGEAFRDRKASLYATGLDRGNSSVGYVAVSTLFMREHNRLCRELSREYPGWDSDRVFQTARNINIVILLKLLLSDYINHILGEQLFQLEPAFADRRAWYRPNWIAVEFDLLYRWHGLVPDELTLGGVAYEPNQFRYNNPLLEELGLGQSLSGVSALPAGRIGLGNTPEFLLGAEYESVRMSRLFRLASYNDYCERFSLPRVTRFDDLSKNPDLVRRLQEMYGSVDKLEYLVGIYAEDGEDGVILGRLMARMVAYDAITQIYSNPLICSDMYHEGTFTKLGLQAIEDATSLQALVNRNVKGGSSFRVSLNTNSKA
ncbi:MAG: peroxidase family protein [Pseudomonadota bacterium]